jgi:hypothetical protein
LPSLVSDKSEVMTRVYIVLLIVATVLVSVTGAFFSVTGLAELFGGSKISVLFMAGALEFSKFIVVGFLYRFWGHIHRPLRNYLLFAVFTLMIITSLGIYGYLSNAYQIASGDFHSHLLEIDNLEKEGVRIENEVSEIKAFIDKVPQSRLTKRLELQKEYEPRLDELRWRGEQVISELNEKNQKLLSINAKVGPIVYVAKAMNQPVDTTVNWLIFIFVLVFDPLAVSLVFSLNILIRLNEKYRGNEYRIGAHAFTSPVDHRLKKDHRFKKSA